MYLAKQLYLRSEAIARSVVVAPVVDSMSAQCSMLNHTYN